MSNVRVHEGLFTDFNRLISVSESRKMSRLLCFGVQSEEAKDFVIYKQ